jgi:ATP-binding cassette subfamily B protein
MSERQVKRTIQRSFEYQQEESDCGVAALSSIIQFHGGYVPLERLRSLSGTNTSGTTMLGLLEAGNEVGLETEAFEGTIDELKKIDSPSLLHVVKNNTQEHYIVCYSFNGLTFLIGDPAEGLKYIEGSKLNELWRSKALLTFSKTSSFQEQRKLRNAKYNWIKHALQVDRHLIISAMLIGVSITTLNFATAIFTEKLVDNLIPSKNSGLIILGLGGWLALMFVKVAFTYFRELILVRQSLSLNIRITNHFISKLIHLPKSFFDSRKKGDLIARLFDTGRVQSSVGVIISQDIIDVLTLIVAVLITFFYLPTIAFFLIILLPAYFSIIYTYYSEIYTANKLVMSSYARNEAAYIDTLTGIEVIKQQSKQDQEQETLQFNFKLYQESIASLSRISINFKTIADVFGLLSIFLILSYCITSVLTENLQIGDMIAIFSISVIALSSTTRLAFAITHLQEAQAALDRTFDIVVLASESDTGKYLENVQKIQMVNVSFGFPGHQLLFENFNLTVQKGSVTILLGENGSGKSTIIQILQNFYSPKAGKIYFDNNRIDEINLKSLRSLLGVVPQQIKIFNQSLAYNITLTHETDHKKLLDFCNSYGLSEFVNSFRDGLYAILGEEGINASGGQRQMIAFARALYIQPEFLLLDEFTSSMDKDTERLALNILSTIKERSGVLIITHNPKLMELADFKYNLNGFE